MLLGYIIIELGVPRQHFPMEASSSTLLLVSECHLLYHPSHLLHIDVVELGFIAFQESNLGLYSCCPDVTLFVGFFGL
jgi:hypothetical protein